MRSLETAAERHAYALRFSKIHTVDHVLGGIKCQLFLEAAAAGLMAVLLARALLPLARLLPSSSSSTTSLNLAGR